MYNCYDYTRPYWTGDTMLHEMFWPIGERVVKTLFPIEEIYDVRSADTLTRFEAGKDYLLRDGCLVIPEDSRIVVMPYSDYNPAEPKPELTSGANFTCVNGGYLRFAEGNALHKIQYEISYRHSGRWDGPIPAFDEAALPRTRRLLAEGKPFRLGYLGDSICVGANASGLCDIQPYTPIWPQMVRERLEQLSGCAIAYRNQAVGGTTSGWGREHATEFFADFPADLFVIAFGMNDASGGVAPEVFLDNCADIARQIRAISPECEFVFVSTTLPNPLANQFSHGDSHTVHEGLLDGLTKTYGASAVLAPVTSMHRYLLTKKHFWDMTGNNINHPNDFLVRVYAQTLLRVIAGAF